MYARTHDPDHLRMARFFDKDNFFAPMVSGQDILAGHHANTHLAQVLWGVHLERGVRVERSGEGRFYWSVISPPSPFPRPHHTSY